MTAGLSIAATGSALAFLLFENSNSRNNQAGFLLGDIVTEKKKLISDSDYGEETTETVIHIHSIAQDQSLSSTYFLKDCNYFKTPAFDKMKNSIVGWYSFRRNVTAVPTLKDRHIHKQMLGAFKGNPETFPLCLLTSSENGDNMSHSFKQHFLVLNPATRRYEAIPLLIENLDNVSPQYGVPLPPTGEKVLSDLIDEKWHSHELISNLRSKLRDQLRDAVLSLVESEMRVSDAENMLLRLRTERDALVKRVQEQEMRRTAMEEERKSNSSRMSEKDGGQMEQGEACGDNNRNRYHERPVQHRYGMRGVLAMRFPPNQFHKEGRSLNPRFPNCDNTKSSYFN